MRDDIITMPGTEARYRTLANKEPQACRAHLQNATGGIVCPYCGIETACEAASVERVLQMEAEYRQIIARHPHIRKSGPIAIQGMCADCTGKFMIFRHKGGGLEVWGIDLC
jgi:hypothetical protein